VRVSRRFMLEGAQYRPKSELGLGALHWSSHVKALQVKSLLHYIDAPRGAWKSVMPSGEGFVIRQ